MGRPVLDGLRVFAVDRRCTLSTLSMNYSRVGGLSSRLPFVSRHAVPCERRKEG